MKLNNLTDKPLDNPLEPEFLRVAEAVARYGPSKPKLYELMAQGELAFVSLRKTGQSKGTRLIHHESLRQYLYSRVEGGAS